ncbi:MAG TPA: hypothetical protein VFD48_02630 [Pyrinomonadaceae bacterium]|nr:hypothetical protein [Pyrinomonadaceae bacterium]
MRVTAVLILILLVATSAFAQRPRTVDTSATAESSTSAIAPAPETVKAKYEGGVFGYNKTMNGTLSFDDTNNRLLFRDKQQKEVLFIPYDAVASAFADTQKRRPAAATVASHIPYIGFPLGLIKTKVQYLTLQYNDPDSKASGITSFKLENKQILASVLKTLAQKAGMTARGEVYVRKQEGFVDKTMP